MIDLHTHILPNVDDGSQSPVESIEILKTLKDQGVDT
ncbi:MAG: capsular biosynthesis protein, partial [Erysipelotrichaceae bacterium]|nr:capsular biosynthesis protein [Erysipelotrichaceae bacterium]